MSYFFRFDGSNNSGSWSQVCRTKVPHLPIPGLLLESVVERERVVTPSEHKKEAERAKTARPAFRFSFQKATRPKPPAIQRDDFAMKGEKHAACH